MNRGILRLVCATRLGAALLAGAGACGASQAAGPQAATREIDFAAVLRLAGARNLDIQLAREKLREAEARYQGVAREFLPSFAVGAAYRRHDNRIQNVEGVILDVDKQSLAAGGTLTAQVELGEAISRRVTEGHRREAARFGVETANSQALRDAAVAYFQLAKAGAGSQALDESLRVSEDYQQQVSGAVDAGVAYKGDELRVRVQTERYRMALRQARERCAVASAALARVLHLEQGTLLTAAAEPLLPLDLVDLNTPVADLVAEARQARPEVREMEAFVAAAEQERRAARLAPLVPSLVAQEFFGALGGGRDGEMDRFGSSSDTLLGVSWRIGPGGLFDASRRRQAEARRNITELEREKLVDRLAAEVVSLHAQAASLRDRTAMARANVQTAVEALAAAAERRQTGVGAVLEVIQSQQDLNQARLGLVESAADQNIAQYELLHALGRLGSPGEGGAADSCPGGG